MGWRKNWQLIVLVLISGWVYLTNLGGQAYSLDEPETVLIARNIIRSGIPEAWDEKNLITTIEGGIDLSRIGNRWIWIWQPWLQHYTAAASIVIFGDNPGGARVLFALWGVATVALVYKLSEEIFGNKVVAFLVGGELAGLMPFFLYVRQVRYYSPTAFFSVLTLYLLVKGVGGKWTKGQKALLVAATGGLFLANYVAWAGAMAAMGIYWWKRNSEKRYLLIVGLAEIIAAAGWFTVFKPFGGNILATSNSQGNVVLNAGMFISYINGFVFNWLMMIPIFMVRGNKAKYLYVIGIWIGVKLVIDAIFFTPHGRYVMELFPVFMVLMGFIYNWLWEKKQAAAAITLMILLTCTSVGLVRMSQVRTGKLQVRWWPEAFAAELTGKFPGEIQVVAEKMKQEARPGDVYWSNNYRFYIYEATGIAAISPWCNKKTGQLEGPDVTDTKKIKWFVCFNGEKKCLKSIEDWPCLGEVAGNNIASQYVRRVINWPEDTYAINDPDIVNRLFPPRQAGKEEVVIYEKSGVVDRSEVK